MATHKICEILGRSGPIQALTRPAQRVAEIERLFLEAAPRSLSGAARVNGIRAGVLLVAADNAAVAAKLRQLAPRLLMHITKRAVEITGIRVEVQPASVGATRQSGGKRPIGRAALRELGGLAEALPDSPLRQALTRFVRRHGNSTG